MNSSLISKIAKAREYAQNAELASIRQLTVEFQGTNRLHKVQYHDGGWECDCDFFPAWRTCSHTMALERMLAAMLPSQPAAKSA